jgi:hypothetical protein
MRETDVSELMQQLLLEVTTQRLITRAIVGHMIANSRKPIASVIASLEEAVEKTAPELFPLPGVDPELQAKASLLAKARTEELLANLGAVVAPPRTSGTKRASRAA